MDLITMTQLLGNIGEFIGAIAVVVTLAYLAVQIRHNTRATRASMDYAIRSDFNRWHELVMADSRMTDLMARLGDPEEDYQARSFGNWILNRYANVQTAFDAGILPREQYPAWKADFERQLEMFPGAIRYMREQMDYYPTNYVELWEILEPLATRPE